jgi:hypothetical protein
MVSATEGWAVGSVSVNTDSATPTPYISTYGGDTSIILHYTGGTWRIAYTRPTRTNTYVDLNTLAMVSPSEGWAAGQEEDDIPAGNSGGMTGNVFDAVTTSYVLHDVDGHWTKIEVPDHGIDSLSMGSPDDGWAIAGNGLIHYHRGVWTEELQG